MECLSTDGSRVISRDFSGQKHELFQIVYKELYAGHNSQEKRPLAKSVIPPASQVLIIHIQTFK